MIRGIDRILVRVTALEAAVKFYHEAFGMRIIRHDRNIASLAMADQDAELILHNDPDLPAEAIYYRVDDVRQLYERREELGLKFISAPAAVARGFRATIKDPFGMVLMILDRMTEGSAALEDGRPPDQAGLFPGTLVRASPKPEALIAIYERIGRTADDLPYTPHFEQLYRDYSAMFGDQPPGRDEVWRHLLNLRKGSKLPRLGEARSIPPPISDEDRAKLRSALGEEIGKRDRLPYTDRFDQLVDEFNRTQPRALSPHLIWRLVATLAK